MLLAIIMRSSIVMAACYLISSRHVVPLVSHCDRPRHGLLLGADIGATVIFEISDYFPIFASGLLWIIVDEITVI